MEGTYLSQTHVDSYDTKSLMNQIALDMKMIHWAMIDRGNIEMEMRREGKIETQVDHMRNFI